MAKIHGLGEEYRIPLLGLKISPFRRGCQWVDMRAIRTQAAVESGDGCTNRGQFHRIDTRQPRDPVEVIIANFPSNQNHHTFCSVTQIKY
jgi:hypothetical protein